EGSRRIHTGLSLGVHLGQDRIPHRFLLGKVLLTFLFRHASQELLLGDPLTGLHLQVLDRLHHMIVLANRYPKVPGLRPPDGLYLSHRDPILSFNDGVVDFLSPNEGVCRSLTVLSGWLRR